MELRVEKYNESEHKDIWDDFVMNQSYNGTLFHTQLFLSYHPLNRFDDCSILIFDNQKLITVFLAAQTSDGIFSHPGTSGGGPVISKKYKSTAKSQEIIDLIFSYYNDNLTIRLPEYFFSDSSNANLIYILSQKSICHTELSLYINLEKTDDLIANVSRSRTRSSIRKQLKEGFDVYQAESEDEYRLYHKMVENNLDSKHGASVTHNLNEFLSLKKLINSNELLLLAKNNEQQIVAGIWIIIASPSVWHIQYIAKDYDTATHAAVSTLLIKGAEIAKEKGAEIYNLGLCTEKWGSVLNEGLCDFKESLGGIPVPRYVFESKKNA